MSKSLGNFYTLRDVLAKGYTGREVRHALMRVHYRAQLNFTWEGMDASRQALNRVDDWLERLLSKAGDPNIGGIAPPPEVGTRFEDALDDDLNISAALGILFESIRETNGALNRNELDASAAKSWLGWWERVNSVLGIESEVVERSGENDPSLPPPNIRALADARAQARLAKNWTKSDELRDQLADLGWDVRDTKDGQKIKRRSGI